MRAVVEAPARIHLGFHSPCRHGARVLGGLGVAASAPGLGVRVVVERAEGGLAAAGCDAGRAGEALREAVERLGLRGGYRVLVEECLPRHVGLGSTTQLVLSVYAGLAALEGISVEEAVEAAGRGPYSGVGTGVFLHGGLVVDAGAAAGDARARPALYARLPRGWRLVAVLPSSAPRGRPEGPAEDSAVEALPGPESPPCMRARRAFLEKLLPGVAEGDFEAFVEALEEIEAATAEAFAAEQGGLFCCRESMEAAEALKRLGARGVGQSSWGPTVYGFFPSPRPALRAAHVLASLLPGARVYVASVPPRGARITLLP